MTRLEVQLTADINQLKKQLKKANNELKNFGAQAERQGSSAQKGFTKAGKGAANATPTLLEFNRVVQDAPFGIQGVANNIQQLTGNFQALSKQAGGSGAALKLLLKEMVGPAGILFAVSAITSLLVTYGDRLFQSTNRTKELTDATKEFAGSAKAEISVLQSLLSIATDESKSRERRNQAVKVLQDKYPNYLKNLNLENATTEKIKNSVNALTKAIENRAKVQGAEALIQKKAQELLLKQEEAQRAYEKSIKNLPTRLQRAQQANKAYAKGIGATSQQIFDIQKNEERLRELANKRLSDSLKESEGEYQEYVKNLKKILSGVPDLLSAFNVSTTASVAKAGEKGGGPINLREIFKVDSSQLTGVFTDPVRDELSRLGILLSEAGPTIIEPGLSKIEQRMASFRDRLAATTVDLSSSISSGFASIGTALAQGDSLFGAIGKSILSTMGSIITQLGQATIAAGIAAISLKGLFSNPFAAIAAGGVLVALGTALSSAKSSVGGIGSSSIGGQGSGGSAGSSSSFVSSSGAFSGGTVVFEIEGQKLVGVLQRTLSKNSRLGGNISFN